MTYKPDDYLKLKQVEKLYSLSRTSVYELRKDMYLFPRFRTGLYLGGKRLRFKELDAFMKYRYSPEYNKEIRELKSVIK